MKKVLIISSSPRIDGNSEILAKDFFKGAKDAGNAVEIIYLRDYSIGYCRGCSVCESTGKCVQNDDMQVLLSKVMEADVLVFATPVYFYCMSGQLKVFIDRLVPIYTKIRSDIYLLCTAWDDQNNMLQSTLEAIRGCTRDCLEGCVEKGALAVGGVHEKGAILHRKEREEAYLMGKQC